MSHNLISSNHLAQWKHSVNETPVYQDQLLDDYFECLIDCKDNDRMCKTYCTELLN